MGSGGRVVGCSSGREVEWSSWSRVEVEGRESRVVEDGGDSLWVFFALHSQQLVLTWGKVVAMRFSSWLAWAGTRKWETVLC